MSNFQVRDHLNSFDDDDAWHEITDVCDEEEAASVYLDEVFPYEDGHGPFEVEVKNASGAISLWQVEVEFEPTFHASPLRKMVVNGKRSSISRRQYSAISLVVMAFPEARTTEGYTITYKDHESGGILAPDGFLTALDGVVVNVARTVAA